MIGPNWGKVYIRKIEKLAKEKEVLNSFPKFTKLDTG